MNWNLTEILTALSLLVAVMSAGMGLACYVAFRRLGNLPTLQRRPESPLPGLSVVMPARNEARDLERSVRSILAQEFVDLQVVIVDDHSADDTPAIADRLAAEDSRVSVLHDPPLQPGWLGKVNALHHGLQLTRHGVILLTDADIVHHPLGLASALAELEREQYDLLSLIPLFEFESFWENVLLPHAMIGGTVQFMLPDVNDPRNSNAAAAGAFIMLRRRTLDGIGGLACIRMEMLDDLELAKAVKRAGFRTRLLQATDLVRVRLFKNNHDAFWGLTKNILGSLKYIWLAIPTMFLPVFVYWVPMTTLALGLIWGEAKMVAAGVLAYVIQVGLVLLATKMCQVRWGLALFFPLAAIPAACCLGKALYFRWTQGAVLWRGRAIRVNAPSATEA